MNFRTTSKSMILGRDVAAPLARSSARDQAIDRALMRVRRAQDAEARKEAAKENMTQKLVQTGEVFGTTAGVSYLMVKGILPSSFNVMGVAVPVALVGGVLLRAASEFLDADQYSDHVRNIGDGMLAQYGTVLGAQLAGTKLPTLGAQGSRAAVGCGPSVGGFMGGNAPEASDAEIVDIMRRYGWAA